MSDTKLKPTNNILILDVIVPLTPIHNGLILRPTRLARRLADIVTSREELALAIFRHPQHFPSKTCAAPDKTAWFAQ
jgi:hypothetical protein